MTITVVSAVRPALIVGIGLALATHSARASGVCTLATIMSPLTGAGTGASLSGDGRFMAFSTHSMSGFSQVLLYDRLTCTTELVSVNSAEIQGNGHSFASSISDDARWVAFQSEATNLGAADSNGVTDVFVRDRLNGTTFNASLPLSGNWADGASFSPAFSGDGLFVAFVSDASDLVAGDTNARRDVFVRDVLNGSTTRVSVATGGLQATGGSPSILHSPAVSSDGRYVAFTSAMTNLVPADTNGQPDVFRHDRQTQTTIRISVHANGSEVLLASGEPDISGDGRYVAFYSEAPLVANDTNSRRDVFVRDVISNLTTRVSLSSHGIQASDHTRSPSMSADGRYVSFSSVTADLVVGDTNADTDVFVHDRQTSLTRRVSATAGGLQARGTGGSLSADGLFIGIFSSASNLVPGDANGLPDVFLTDWRFLSAPPNVNLLVNSNFVSSLAPWTTFALPDYTYMDWLILSGILYFTRDVGSTQAVVLQRTGAQLLAGSPLTAQFDLGNISGGRKRISVLLHEGDFTDLSVCTFWLDAGAPMRVYGMRTHTTKYWANATVSLYAATADGTPAYQVDNVLLSFNPAASSVGTDCIDPTKPSPPGGGSSANLLANADFSGGLPPWSTFGQIVWQIASGVFEFYRPPGTPAGVVLQATGQPITNNQIITAAFHLGNSSSVRKRVTVLLHDADFSDLSACTFWLPPAMPLAPFGMRTFATEAWTNATLSLYGATIGTEPFMRFDSVALHRTPATAALGTECFEPDPNMLAPSSRGIHGSLIAPARAAVGSTTTLLGDWHSADGFTTDVEARGHVATWRAFARSDAPPATLQQLLDLRAVSRAYLSFRSRRSSSSATAEVQVSADGVSWQTLAAVPATEDWTPVSVDLSAFAGQLVHVRFVLYTHASHASPDTWSLADLRFATAGQVVAGSVFKSPMTNGQ